MKLVSKFMVVALLVLLVATAFAADAKKVSFTLEQPTTFNGTTLSAGQYVAYVERDGANANVRIRKGDKEVVNTTAAFREMTDASVTALVVDTARNVKEIRSSKLKGALVFSGAPANSAAGGK